MGPTLWSMVLFILVLTWQSLALRTDTNAKEWRKTGRKLHKKRDLIHVQTGARHWEECPPSKCQVKAVHYTDVRTQFLDISSNKDYLQLINFRIDFGSIYNVSLLDELPYMGGNFRASQLVWVAGQATQLLKLPLDAAELSLHVLDQPDIGVQVEETPSRCFIRLSPECRLQTVRRLLINNITYTRHHHNKRSFLCHRFMKSTGGGHFQHSYKCCETDQYSNGIEHCSVLFTSSGDTYTVTVIIFIIASILTLFSPALFIKLKLLLQFNTVTKFFRASLKHGITGQRNYVIRISSRQLINLQDSKPFSLPRVLLRLAVHCYGEGRCCIHWWGQWSAQPSVCKKQSCPQRAYFTLLRILTTLFINPGVFYLALALYYKKLELFKAILNFTANSNTNQPPTIQHNYLNVNPVALVLMPRYFPLPSLLLLCSLAAFLYTLMILSWPNNPLERCLLQYTGKRTTDQPKLLYNKLTAGYKDMLYKLAYGDYTVKRHLFRIRCVPWGLRRLCLFVSQFLLLIPIINIAITMCSFDSKLFNLKKTSQKEDYDELLDNYDCGQFSCLRCCQWLLTVIIWLLFLLILTGYCIYVFVMVQFLLHVLFYTTLACIIQPCNTLPWLALILVILFYTNDTLATLNREHRDILALIDENSPRISAVEDSENLQDGAVHILRSHNLGAVKFIDGDNTEYVSKELYYNVCTDLKCGWSHSVRRVFYTVSVHAMYAMFVFTSANVVSSLVSSTITVTLSAVVLSLLPKLYQCYTSVKLPKQDKKSQWAKIIPEVLDRHIRVDRQSCVDEEEVELSTYDVRPVGQLVMELPRAGRYGNLRVWKYPWTVSADQQTQTAEGFLVALSSKLAAASFLGRLVTRHYPPELDEESVLRQWSLLVENCVLEGGVTASSINGTPLESVRLFPPDIQPLVSPFRTANTIDSVVDNINRELYGPYTKGVLVTIGNTPIAIWKLDNIFFAFNAGCHGDQVTDLFGAVLIVTDFNTQNLQTVIKFIMDPYSPDLVPVYSVIATEGFIFRSPEILELESPESSESRV